MNMPWCPFYPRDWMGDMQLRGCSYAARGLWAEMLCIMAMAERRGYLVVNDRPLIDPAELARLTSGRPEDVRQLLAELEVARVFSRDENGVIYSRRIVREEAKRESTRKRVAKHRGACNAPCNGESPESRVHIPDSDLYRARGVRPSSGGTQGGAEAQDGQNTAYNEEGQDKAPAIANPTDRQRFVTTKAPLLEVVLSYAAAKGYPADKAERFHALNTENEWRFPNGAVIGDWRTAFENFCKKSKPNANPPKPVVIPTVEAVIAYGAGAPGIPEDYCRYYHAKTTEQQAWTGQRGKLIAWQTALANWWKEDRDSWCMVAGAPPPKS